jgi:hypothetical protein
MFIIVYGYEYILVIFTRHSCNPRIKLIQSIEGNELTLSMWINIHSMDLAASNQAGLSVKLPAVVAVGNRSNLLLFSRKRI